MKVSELIAKLKEMPQDAHIAICADEDYAWVNNAVLATNAEEVGYSKGAYPCMVNGEESWLESEELDELGTFAEPFVLLENNWSIWNAEREKEEKGENK